MKPVGGKERSGAKGVSSGREPREERACRRAMEKPLALVGFYAPWCAPCRLQEPILNAVAEQAEGRLHIVRVNIEACRKKAGELGIHAVPTLILYRHGKEQDRWTGLQPASVLSKAIEPYLINVERSV